MKTLLDFGRAVEQVREAIDSLEVKGRSNATLIVYACNKCDEIIRAINEVVHEMEVPHDGQNGEDSAAWKGENVNGESDSDAAGSD